MAIASIKLPEEDLISELKFAQLVGRTLRTVRRWGVERTGPVRTRIGRSVFFSKAAIAKFLRDREEAS